MKITLSKSLLCFGSSVIILAGMSRALASTESEAVLANFGPLEWVAGINWRSG